MPDNVEIALDKPVELDATDPLGSYALDGAHAADFHEQFRPTMMQYVARVEFGELRPNVVLQMDQNPLPHLNMTLADFVKANGEVFKGVFGLKGTRQIRAGYDTALQWYSYEMPVPTEDDPNNAIAFQVFQKYAVSGDRLGILTITYPAEGSDPEHIRCLHELLKRFAVARDGGAKPTGHLGA